MDCAQQSMVADLMIQIQKAENELKATQSAIDDLEQADYVPLREDCTPSVFQLLEENDSLKYRMVHLKRAIDAANVLPNKAPTASNPCNTPSSIGPVSMSLSKTVTSIFQAAIDAAFPGVPDLLPASVTPSTKPAFGDYQCNSGLHLAKLLKQKPRDVAQSIMASLPTNSVFEKVEIAGAGFINAFLTKEHVAHVLKRLAHGEKPVEKEGKHQVVIDYSSPNVAKEMHVGHLRSTIIGDSIANLLEYMGCDVLRLNHVGDWGTQFGMLIAHLEDEFPNFCDVSPPIADLQAFYKQAKIRFDNDEPFKKRAMEAVVRLQSHEPRHKQAWKLICDVSSAEFTKIYERLHIGNLQIRGESFYQDRMQAVVQDLKSKGLTIVEDRRMLMFVPGFKLPLTLVKSDGGFTYDTSDMAAIKQRLQEEKADSILYVVDAGQGSHFEVIYGAARLAGWYDPKVTRVEHVGFGVVLGEDKKKFKTRSGDTVRLVDLLDEGVRRSEAKLKEKEREQVLTAEEMERASLGVAYGCVKYADLSHNRTHDYVFSFDKMLDDKGNTAAYLLYAYTRIRSISRVACISDSELRSIMAEELPPLEHAREWKLAKCVARVGDVLTRAREDLLMHSICEYVYELCCTFTEFYDECYCVERDRKTREILKVNKGRILLCELTALVMDICFGILGIQPVSRM